MVTQSLSFFQASLMHIESGQLAWQHTNLPCPHGSKLSIMGKVGSRMASSSLHSSNGFSIFAFNWRLISWHPHIPMPVLLHLGESATSGSLGVEHFQPFLDVSGNFLSTVKVSDRTYQMPIQTSNSICTLVDGGSLASHSSQYVGRCLSSESHCKRFCQGCLLGWMLKGLWSLHLFLCLLEDVLTREGFSTSFCKAVVKVTRNLWQRFTTNVGKNEQVGVLKTVYKQYHFCP